MFLYCGFTDYNLSHYDMYEQVVTKIMASDDLY